MLFICVVWTVSQLCRCGQTKGDRIWTLMLTRPLTPAAVRLHSWRTKVHPVTADQSQRCSDRQISSVLLWSHKTGSRPIFIPSGATIRYNQEGEATFPRSRPDQISMGHARTSLNTGGPPCLELVLTHQGTNLHLVRWSQRPEVLRHQPGLWIPHIPISIHGSCRNRSDPLRPTISGVWHQDIVCGSLSPIGWNVWPPWIRFVLAHQLMLDHIRIWEILRPDQNFGSMSLVPPHNLQYSRILQPSAKHHRTPPPRQARAKSNPR